MNSGHTVRIIDKQLAGEETYIDIDGMALAVTAYAVSREVDGLCKVTFTIIAKSAIVDHESAP